MSIINMHTLTVVTAFVADINTREDRTIEDYITLGEKLLMVNIPIIIFIDETTFLRFFAGRESEFSNTRFVQISKKDIYLYQYKELAANFSPITENKNKDTYEFIMVQCMKTEWVRQAIEMNIFNTDQYAWIDFGISHFIPNIDDLNAGIEHMAKASYISLRMPNTKPPDFPFYSRNILHHIVWMFPGSLFGGGKGALLKFAREVKAKCLTLLSDYKLLIWEINVWYLVFFENVQLFDLYKIETHKKDIMFLY
jgi:hypothetical protein